MATPAESRGRTSESDRSGELGVSLEMDCSRVASLELEDDAGALVLEIEIVELIEGRIVDCKTPIETTHKMF